MVTGGTPPYIYEWGNGSSNASSGNVSAGTYNLVVRDANGCVLGRIFPTTVGTIISGTVTQPAEVTAPSASAQTFTTIATVANLIPVPSATIKWYNVAIGGAALASTTLLATGTYYVTTTNASGCESARTSVAITAVDVPATHLNFDGFNDRGELPASVSDALAGGTEVTIEYWFKGTKIQSAVRFQNNSGYIVAGWTGGGTPQFIVSTDGGTNGVVLGGSSEVQDNSWHHVACVWKKGDIFATYLDGVLRSSRVAADVFLPSINAATPFIGSYNGNSEFTNGNLDDIRIWNVARTASQISDSRNCELQGTETGLVAYYKFNQGFNAVDNTAITTLTDASVNAYNGTLTNLTLNGFTSNWLAGSPVASGITCASLSASSFDSASFNVYPNPTTGIFNVNTSEIMQLQLYDLLGKNILNQKIQVGSSTVNIDALPTGVYVLKATNSQGKTNSYKVIKM